MQQEQLNENETTKLEDTTNNEYNDIINRRRHTSATHPQMSLYDRAAQFAPFAALNN